MNNLDFGVNVIGYIDGEFGLGEAVRLNIKAINKVSYPVSLFNYNVDTNHRHADKTFVDFSEDLPFKINLIQISPSEVPALLSSNFVDKIKDKYNILYVAWESEFLPEDYVNYINFFDEIWVPSKYCLEVISSYSCKPVVNIPHPVELNYSQSDEIDGIIDNSKFNFMFIFDYNSTLERKNTLSLIKAFKSAFKNQENVNLIIKTSSSIKYSKEKSLLENEIGINKNITIVEKIFDKLHINYLISKCDCYISLHKAEGFGLTLAEAMFVGKPVIATGYSGNTEFMNFQNSFLVNFKKVSVNEDLLNYSKNTIWAEPDIESAIKLLKRVYENSNEVKEISLSGQETIKNDFSFEKIGRKIEQRLNFIHNRVLSEIISENNLKLIIENQSYRYKFHAIEKSNLICLILKVKLYFRNRKLNKRKRKLENNQKKEI